jgi:MtN3 and saliva related transmembrane protein
MEELGLLAALLTSISQLPQVIKTIKTKDTHSISLWTYLMLWTGIILWLI